MQHKFPPRSLPCIRLAPYYTTSFIELLDPAKPNLLMESLNKLQMATYMEMLQGPLLTAFIQSCLLDALTEDKHAGRTYDSCSLIIRSKSRLRNFVESFCKDSPLFRFRSGFPNTLTCDMHLCFISHIGLLSPCTLKKRLNTYMHRTKSFYS
jgi:hypothetical protein